jgi:hypothetical protein
MEVEFHENPSGGNRADMRTDGRTDTDRQTDINEANRRLTLTRLKIWMLKETEWVSVDRINLAHCRSVVNMVMNL